MHWVETLNILLLLLLLMLLILIEIVNLVLVDQLIEHLSLALESYNLKLSFLLLFVNGFSVLLLLRVTSSSICVSCFVRIDLIMLELESLQIFLSLLEVLKQDHLLVTLRLLQDLGSLLLREQLVLLRNHDLLLLLLRLLLLLGVRLGG